jgi:hypothetical protein
MKYILLILIFSSCLFWCSNNDSVIKETGEITNWYVDTLELSIEDARNVVENENIRNNKLKEEIEKY